MFLSSGAMCSPAERGRQLWQSSEPINHRPSLMLTIEHRTDDADRKKGCCRCRVGPKASGKAMEWLPQLASKQGPCLQSENNLQNISSKKKDSKVLSSKKFKSKSWCCNQQASKQGPCLQSKSQKLISQFFLATLVALHFTPVSQSVSHWAEFPLA